MNERQHIERRLRRLSGMSPERLNELHKASGSTEWWARCWSCKRASQRTRDEMDHANCPHCGVNLMKRDNG